MKEMLTWSSSHRLTLVARMLIPTLVLGAETFTGDGTVYSGNALGGTCGFSKTWRAWTTTSMGLSAALNLPQWNSSLNCGRCAAWKQPRCHHSDRGSMPRMQTRRPGLCVGRIHSGDQEVARTGADLMVVRRLPRRVRGWQPRVRDEGRVEQLLGRISASELQVRHRTGGDQSAVQGYRVADTCSGRECARRLLLSLPRRNPGLLSAASDVHRR